MEVPFACGGASRPRVAVRKFRRRAGWPAGPRRRRRQRQPAASGWCRPAPPASVGTPRCAAPRQQHPACADAVLRRGGAAPHQGRRCASRRSVRPSPSSMARSEVSVPSDVARALDGVQRCDPTRGIFENRSDQGKHRGAAVEGAGEVAQHPAAIGRAEDLPGQPRGCTGSLDQAWSAKPASIGRAPSPAEGGRSA